MGDRGNVNVVSGEKNSVWLYTHFDGSELEETVRAALLRGKDRWDDAQYLARIIFCEMIKDDVEGLTGYGITSIEWDGGKTVKVNVANQTVTYICYEKEQYTKSFENFVVPEDSEKGEGQT